MKTSFNFNYHLLRFYNVCDFNCKTFYLMDMDYLNAEDKEFLISYKNENRVRVKNAVLWLDIMEVRPQPILDRCLKSYFDDIEQLKEKNITRQSKRVKMYLSVMDIVEYKLTEIRGMKLLKPSNLKLTFEKEFLSTMAMKKDIDNQVQNFNNRRKGLLKF